MITPQRTAQPWFPKVRPHAPDTIQTPPWHTLSLTGKINQTLWSIGKRFGERDTKFALKTGMAVALLAAPAFIDSTRPTFVDFFGDWALISVNWFPLLKNIYPAELIVQFYVVMSPTIGAVSLVILAEIASDTLTDELPRSPAVPWHFVRHSFLMVLDIHVITADLVPLLLCYCIPFSLKTRLHFHFSALSFPYLASGGLLQNRNISLLPALYFSHTI